MDATLGSQNIVTGKGRRGSKPGGKKACGKNLEKIQTRKLKQSTAWRRKKLKPLNTSGEKLKRED